VTLVEQSRTASAPSSAPDPLRRAIGHMATSVTLVTTVHDGRRHGFTANSFTSVSRNPPLVTVFLSDTADCYGAFAATEEVAVNILAEGQGDIARQFATKGIEKFDGVELDPRRDSVPVVAGAMATILGRVELRQAAGDHLMLLIAVDDVIYTHREPLVYHNRAFRKLV
jgi:flavin reductase (DIM6/NTAB) family NADH-FMN oxidoreductase RutF